MSGPSALLSLKGYAAGYAQRPVFQPITLDLGVGDVVIVAGENGSGKSTLLRGIAGLTEVEVGRVSLFGRDMTALRSVRRIESGIAYVSQSGGLFDHLSISENLRLAGAKPGRANARLSSPANDLMSELRLRLDTPVGRLSGGERRLVALVRAFAAGARAFLLDEPLAGIAPERRPEVVEKAVSLVKRAGAGALWVEHMAPDLAAYCSGELRIGSAG